ncbi:hypothetical protein Q5P01_006223 [Channa striata]|uniref:Dipeptidase n=1 Tax=Channa striata TaxID=64152 RepID=A0AA88SWT8_CHASR|nr:hypothetical protein Q5P01_006223 [Channa striata]
MFTGCGVVTGQSQYLTKDAVRPHPGLEMTRQNPVENGTNPGTCSVYQEQTYGNSGQPAAVNASSPLKPAPLSVPPRALKLGQEGFKKVCRTEEDSPCPFPGLASGVLEMRVKEGSKIRNLMGFAMARMQGVEGVSAGGMSGGGLRQVVFTGSGRAVTKTITCAEIMKRKVGALHQLTKLRYKVVKEVWESSEGGTSEMTVHRTVPSISILLSKDPLDPLEPGYQPPETLSALWEEKEGVESVSPTACKRPLGPLPYSSVTQSSRPLGASRLTEQHVYAGHTLHHKKRRTFSFRMQSLGRLMILSFLWHFTSGYTERQRVQDLMSRYPLIDGHNDLPLQLRILHNNRLSQIDLHNVSKVATDITRLNAGHVQAQVFSAYVMCGAQDKDAVRLTMEQIDVIRRMCTEYEDFELVTSTQELKNSQLRHKIACLISIEGGHSIDSSLPALRMFYQLGVRSMSLTHTCNTPWAESSSKLYNFYQRKHNSLTHFGKAVVDEMNRLGMIVDLSHTSWDTAQAVLNHSRAPVIFSHSSSYTVCNHSRNVPDWLLLELKKKQGLIMVNLYSQFISCGNEANISHVADHFDHIKKMIGAESIGIGGDFEGAVRFPQGLEDVSKYPALIQELLRRNWTENELADVLRRNFIRVFEMVERVRDRLSLGRPSEVQIPLEVVQNPCRLVLRPPNPRGMPSVKSVLSGAPHRTQSLLTVIIALLLSNLCMTK